MPAAFCLHHVGFVVEDIRRSMPGLVQSLQGTWDGRIWHDPLQGVSVAFLERPGEASIELVMPAGAASPVSRFLESNGGGLHHMCYAVADLDAAVNEFRSRGAVLAAPAKPAVAFEGRRIAWLMTREKLLIELLEQPDVS